MRTEKPDEIDFVEQMALGSLPTKSQFITEMADYRTLIGKLWG